MTTSEIPYRTIVSGEFAADDGYACYLGRPGPGMHIPECPDCGGEISREAGDCPDPMVPVCQDCGSQFVVQDRNGRMFLKRLKVHTV